MADIIPQNFPIGGEQAIASYNFIDIAEGTGTVSFYGFSADNGSSGATYVLSNNAQFSDDIYTSGSTLFSAPGNSFNLNFDSLAFNTQKRIKGTAVVTIPWAQNLTPSGGTSGAVQIRINKLSSGVSTELVSGATTYIGIIGADVNYYLSTIKIPIDTVQKFAKGDQIRVNVLGHVSNSSGNTQMSLAHDPQNRDGVGAYNVGVEIDTTIFKVD